MNDKKVKCPHCGYEMPLLYNEHTECSGLKVRCKGRNCKKEFLVNIRNNKQIK